MARNIRQFDVFISSPSDVRAERDAVEKAIETVNQLIGVKEGYRLNPIRWEKDVSSQIGKEPQTIINEQIGDEYDIFVGVLCNRFGQETIEYESGTEEEFSRAYERHKTGKDTPQILFYFKDPRASATPIDPDQLVKVATFQKAVQKVGIYGEFDSLENFSTLLLAALPKAVERLDDRTKTVSTHVDRDDNDVSTIASANTEDGNASEFDEDVGMFELLEMIESSTGRLANLLNGVANATSELGSKVKTQAAEISSLKSTATTRAGKQNLKGVFERVALEMNNYSDKIDEVTPNAKTEFSSALNCMQHAILISRQDNLASKSEIDEFSRSLISLRAEVIIGYGKMAEFRDTLSSIQRLTTPLNQAKRRAVISTEQFMVFLTESAINMDAVLDSFN